MLNRLAGFFYFFAQPVTVRQVGAPVPRQALLPLELVEL
jgi:hypothetical protein